MSNKLFRLWTRYQLLCDRWHEELVEWIERWKKRRVQDRELKKKRSLDRLLHEFSIDPPIPKSPSRVNTIVELPAFTASSEFQPFVYYPSSTYKVEESHTGFPEYYLTSSRRPTIDSNKMEYANLIELREALREVVQSDKATKEQASRLRQVNATIKAIENLRE